MKDYYEARASEYDDWYLGTGLFAARDRPGWHAEVVEVQRVLEGLRPARTVDIACGTGFLTAHLPGEVVGVDQSPTMVRIARQRLPRGRVIEADAFGVPFADGSFERVFTAHFYGHLAPAERAAFLAEARRLAPELVVVDSALREDVQPEEWQERVLNDGSRHRVYKRFFTAEGLAEELGGAEALHAGRWFVAVRA